MSERSTLPPDDDTTPGLTIPAAPPNPSFDAPDWVLRIVDEMQQTRSELSAAMGEFAEGVHGIDKIAAMQERLAATLDLVLSEVRSQGRRIDLHDERLAIGERRFESIEARVGALEQRVSQCPACGGTGG